MLREYCAEHDLPYDACGKLVVAVERDELARLARLSETASANGVPGLRRLGPTGIVEVEPHAAGLAALHSPGTAITDFARVAASFAADVADAGGRVLLSHPVTGIRRRPAHVEVQAGERAHRLRGLVLCAGLQADRVAALAGHADEPRIVPFRGEYLEVSAERRDLVRGMVYPVPDPRTPFLGVHFTRRVDGALEVGPNAVLALDREGYGRRDLDWRDVRSVAAWPGSWRMARHHWRTGLDELRGALSLRAYVRRASRYVPAIGVDDVARSRTGIRAQAVDRDGALVDDFRITVQDGIVSVRNAPSPAATSSLAIAEHVVDRVDLPG